MKHSFRCWSKHVGVLSRVTGMISRRGYQHLPCLTAVPTEDSTMSRLTATVNADEVGYEQSSSQRTSW